VTTLRDLLDRAARRHAGRPAILGPTRLTHVELRERARRFAAALRGLGIEPGARVALLMRNCAEYLELLHGLPAGGFVVVPLNWRLAEPELAAILRDADASVLVTSEEYLPRASKLCALPPPLCSITTAPGRRDGHLSYDELVAAAPDEWLGKVAPDDVAYILYTSGTTGAPKGVVLTHRSVVHSAVLGVAHDVFQDLSHDDRFLVFVPLYHSAGTVTAVAALAFGAAVYPMASFEVDEVFAIIARERITRMTAVPFVLFHMVEYPADRPVDTSSLQTILYAGAPTPVPTLIKAIERFGPVFAQAYGLTESGPSGTALSIDAHRAALASGRTDILASAGREMIHCDVRIVDDAGRALETGAIGEVAIRSSSVMREYWRQPEATRHALQDRWLRTGDIGHMDGEGYLHLIDRKKDMIITGGENVYPAEVEKVLAEHPALAEAAVFGVPDPEWGERIAVAFVPRSGARLAVEDLVGFCRERLAGYKCPRLVRQVESLPRNPSGKVLKRELRRLFDENR
jgi:long-chain acyl-CoA synthetase